MIWSNLQLQQDSTQAPELIVLSHSQLEIYQTKLLFTILF